MTISELRSWKARSGYRNVYQVWCRNRFFARVKRNGRDHYLGCYPTAAAAAQAVVQWHFAQNSSVRMEK